MRECRQLLTGEEGVGPVIGVILMVAITVMLVAVVAAFVLGFGEQEEVAPQTAFEFDFNGSAVVDPGEPILVITATAGDRIDSGVVVVTVGGEERKTFDNNITAGESLEMDLGDGFVGDDNGKEVAVVWESSDGDRSVVIDSFDLPESAD